MRGTHGLSIEQRVERYTSLPDERGSATLIPLTDDALRPDGWESK